MRDKWSWLEKIYYKEDRGIVFTCAVNSIPRIPWLAGAHKGSFSVFATGVCITVVLSCFTFIYIWKKEVRHWIIKTDLVFLSQQLLWPTTIAIWCDQISFSKRGQSSNLSPLKLIFLSKGFAPRLVLRQKLESTRKWPIRITIYLTYYLAINEWGWVGYEELSKSRRVLSTEAEGRGK